MDLNTLIQQRVDEIIRQQLDPANCKSVYTGSIPVLASTSLII